MTSKVVFADVAAEVLRAEKKHPGWPSDAVHAAAIVGEEAGELLQAALQWHYEGGNLASMRKEAVQTAAMAVRFLIYLEGS